jgi:hypothetical protein
MAQQSLQTNNTQDPGQSSIGQSLISKALQGVKTNSTQLWQAMMPSGLNNVNSLYGGNTTVPSMPMSGEAIRERFGKNVNNPHEMGLKKAGVMTSRTPTLGPQDLVRSMVQDRQSLLETMGQQRAQEEEGESLLRSAYGDAQARTREAAEQVPEEIRRAAQQYKDQFEALTASYQQEQEAQAQALQAQSDELAQGVRDSSRKQAGKMQAQIKESGEEALGRAEDLTDEYIQRQQALQDTKQRSADDLFEKALSLKSDAKTEYETQVPAMLEEARLVAADNMNEQLDELYRSAGAQGLSMDDPQVQAQAQEIKAGYASQMSDMFRRTQMSVNEDMMQLNTTYDSMAMQAAGLQAQLQAQMDTQGGGGLANLMSQRMNLIGQVMGGEMTGAERAAFLVSQGDQFAAQAEQAGDMESHRTIVRATEQAHLIEKQAQDAMHQWNQASIKTAEALSQQADALEVQGADHLSQWLRDETIAYSPIAPLIAVATSIQQGQQGTTGAVHVGPTNYEQSLPDEWMFDLTPPDIDPTVHTPVGLTPDGSKTNKPKTNKPKSNGSKTNGSKTGEEPTEVDPLIPPSMTGEQPDPLTDWYGDYKKTGV